MNIPINLIPTDNLLQKQIIRFVIQLAAFIVVSIVIKALHRNLMKVHRKEGIEYHVHNYKEKIVDLRSQKANLPSGASCKGVNKQLRYYITLTRSLVKWGDSGEERKADSIYGHNLILAGVFLFLEMAMRGAVTPLNPDIRPIMFFFMGIYLLAFIHIVRKIEHTLYLDKDHIKVMSKVINMAGDISLVFVLTLTSLFQSSID
jgi:hypothetical protein